MKKDWSKSNIRKEFLDFQAFHLNVTKLQKEIHSQLHELDNDLVKISNDEEMNDANCEQYYQFLEKVFQELLIMYKKIFD